MSEAIHSITSIPAPFNMIVLIVLIVTASSVVKVIAMQVRSFAVHRQELEFKRELIDKGLHGEEIEQVIRAHGPNVNAKK